jgi:hypothetical protein
VADRDFVGLTNSTALQVHIARHAARLGMRLRFRALEGFRRDLPDGRGRGRHCRGAGSRREALRPVDADLMVRIRDPWANRRLAICARSFKALPRPAKQLVEQMIPEGVGRLKVRATWVYAVLRSQ